MMNLIAFLVIASIISIPGHCGQRSNSGSCTKRYDFIIIGAGTGGSMVASELATQFPDDKILMIEEGSFSSVNPTIDNLRNFLDLVNDVTVERGYKSTPQASLNNREITLSRAKVTGGCGSHNANNYILADEMDFNRWGDIPGWSLDDVLDTWDEIDAVNSGTQFDSSNGFMKRLFNAAEDNGYQYIPNWFNLRNGTQNSYSSAIIQGKIENSSYVSRRSAWTDFVEPILPADNLDILILTRVNKINFETSKKSGKIKAISVETQNLGTNEIISYQAKKEIILAAGAYDTPKILMLSGVGDCDYLYTAHNIDCVMDLPGVGQNLQDHTLNFIVWVFTGGDITGIQSEMSDIVLNDALLSATDGIGVLVEHGKWLLRMGPSTTDIVITMFTNQLESVGNVTLRDSNPGSAPVIDHNYLGDENGDDLESLVEGVKLARALIENTTAFDDLNSLYGVGIVEVAPGIDVQSDEEIKEWIRNNVESGTHPTSSCTMGKQSDYNNGDDSIVVNEKLKLFGIENLRIADASIMPIPVSVNTNQMTMVIGKKAAKFIAEDWQYDSSE